MTAVCRPGNCCSCFSLYLHRHTYSSSVLILIQNPLHGNNNNNNGLTSAGPFDPFVTPTTPLSTASGVSQVPPNPYAHDPVTALGSGAFFANQSGFQQPVCSGPYSSERCCGSVSLTSFSFNTIFMPRLDPTARTRSVISATCTIFSCRMTFAKSCRKRPRRHCKPCPVRGLFGVVGYPCSSSADFVCTRHPATCSSRLLPLSRSPRFE